jgi:hypothetical protein
MGRRGPLPKPYLQAVREGTLRERRRNPGLTLAPADLREPDWTQLFPSALGVADDPSLRVRAVARRAWRDLVGRAPGLAEVDAHLVQEYAVSVARLDQCEREISIRGALVAGQRGMQKNGAITIAGQYRRRLRECVRELAPAMTTDHLPPALDADPFD